MTSRVSEYKAGLVAGTNASLPMGDFELFSKGEDFALGYTVGQLVYTVRPRCKPHRCSSDGRGAGEDLQPQFGRRLQ